MLPVRGSVLAVPLADGCADVVVAGEILEHVDDDVAVLAECARLLRPGGTLVIDAIAATRLARVIAVRIAERIPGGPPPGIHDPALFVDRARLLAAADRLGLDLRLVGLRPSLRDAGRLAARPAGGGAHEAPPDHRRPLRRIRAQAMRRRRRTPPSYRRDMTPRPCAPVTSA